MRVARLERRGRATGALSSGLVVLLAAAMLANGCRQSEATVTDGGLQGRLVLTGSSTVAPLMGEIARRFEQRHSGVRIDVQTGGSARGIADATSGLADIGMSSRALEADEAARLQEHLLAYDGIAFAVHASNPVSALSDAQLRSIYRGETRSWSELGGHPAPITVVSRAASRSELELVCAYLGLDPAAIEADIVSGENQHALKTVAGDPDAIVFLSLGAAETEIARGSPLKLLDLAGVPATSASVRAGAYPITRPLVLLTRRASHEAGAGELAQRLIGFARSGAVDDLVVSLAYVPLDPAATDAPAR